MSRRAATDSSEIRIRRARRADLAALVALENNVFSSDRISARQLRHHLASPRAAILVGARGADIVAAAVLFFHGARRYARLYSIAVAPHARGAGLGEALVAAAERIARAHGSDGIRLEVRTDNASARRLYERLGYRRIGTKPRFYEDGHDALHYEKRLAGARGVSARGRS